MPQKPGVYIFLDNNEKVLYVGKAINLRSRVSSYFSQNAKLFERTSKLVDKIEKIKTVIVESELEALLLEAFYIKKYNPYYNIRLSDDKSYTRIRITIKDKYPSVLLARSNPKEQEDQRSVYYGPYTNSSAVKLVLRTIRKVFPFVSVINHPKRICLYNHLGLCPCPPIFDSPQYKSTYKKNINGIIKILEGKSRDILEDLIIKRDKYSRQEDFEEAKIIQSRINALNHIIQPRHLPFEYHTNPNLRSDIRKNEIEELVKVLKANQIKVAGLDRIECYDISNTQGTHATGSMVVMANGEKDTSQYRRFKIRKINTPNDFAMITQIIERRIKYLKNWGIPDLIIIDGGKGQVSSAASALRVNNIQIPVIGLAKRDEIIIIPHYQGLSKSNYKLHNYTFTQLRLSRNSNALKLIMRIRDEAHRFAINYHKLLRSKNTLI